ncbi:MAG: GNAT family N-acetyltransferase [Desulfobacterales bacterium]
MRRQPVSFRTYRPEDLPEILRIQNANLVANLSEQEKADGFLLVGFSIQQFEEIHREIPVVVADLGSRLGGYLCGTSIPYSRGIPLLDHMIGLFQTTRFRGRTLDRCCVFLYGPVCIDRAMRGQGILEGLHDALLRRVAGRYDVGVLFISRNNPRSLNAHTRKLGIEPLKEFEFDGAGFTLLAFEVSHPNHSLYFKRVSR